MPGRDGSGPMGRGSTKGRGFNVRSEGNVRRRGAGLGQGQGQCQGQVQGQERGYRRGFGRTLLTDPSATKTQ
ncbi:DUF5320 family protein [Desulfosporosinus sp. FKA]|uniref:DUF5320 family protein n=1 Tax=Desulfosporosinus sp. FKA TaxID=1969834 RepID=UPI000B4A429E|nr:DUF5320 family protein [Desulfosporosinus sp. FKA]